MTTILKKLIKKDREHVLKNSVYRPTLIFKTGNAAGMKISSLHKLTDIRSNRWMKKAKQKQNIATINGSQINKKSSVQAWPQPASVHRWSSGIEPA